MTDSPTPAIQERLETIENVLLRFIAGELEERIPVSPRGDHVDAIATGINILVEEFSSISAERDDRQALRRISEHLAEAQEIAHLGSWAWTRATDSMVWSDETYRILGFAPGEITPTYERYLSKVHEEDRAEFERQIHEAIEQQSRFQFEHRVWRPDHTFRVLACKGRVLDGDSGAPPRLHATIHDITAIKDAERRMEEARSQGQRLDAALLDLSRTLKEEPGGLHPSLKAITRAATLALRLERCSLWLYTEDRQAIRCIDLYTLSDDSHHDGHQLTSADYPAYFEALETQRIVAAHDALTDPRTREFSDDYLGLFGITSMLDTPIHLGGTMIGAVCHEHTGPARRWTAEEQHFGAAIGAFVAQTLEADKRSEIQQALQASEARYRTHLEQTPVVTYTAALDRGRFTYVSPKIETLLGHTAKAWRDSQTLWADSVHPEDRSRVLAEVLDCGRTKTALNITYRMTTTDEETIWVRDQALAVASETDDETIWQGVLLDITELITARQSAEVFKAAEAHWRSLFDQAPHYIITTDLDLRVTSINRAMPPLSRSDVLGQALGNFEAPEAAGTVRTEADWVFKTRQIRNFELYALGPHSTWAWFDCHIGPLEEEGEINGFMFLALDITETRRLRQDLANKRTMEAIGRLTSGITHDFNNIMMAIGGYADLALRELGEDVPAHGMVAKLRKTARRAQALVNRLPTFGRDSITQPRLVDVNELVADMRDLISPLIGPDIQLTISPDEKPMVVRIDPSQLEQVVLNLVVNARDAIDEDGTLEIRVRRKSSRPGTQEAEPASGSFIQLSVQDNGSGMDEYTLQRLFEPFFTTKTERMGRGGLGLFICYEIANQVGGRLEVESEPGKGTNIDVLLPEVAGQVTPATLTERVQSAASGHETILAVDDDPDVNDLLAEVLEAYGYTVLRAEDGQHALDLLTSLGEPHIDLLLTDVMMPRMGGQELAETLRNRRPQLPIIFASGFVETAKKLQFNSADSRFVRKPISPIALAQEIRQLLDAPRDEAATTDPLRD